MYSSDMTDSQWQFIAKILDNQRKRKYSFRLILNGLFYLNRTGCQWRSLPKTYPPFSICFYYYQLWQRNGLWVKINQCLVEAYRCRQGKDRSPSVGIIDSQSVKNSEWGVPDKGFDGYKRIKGRKRHIVVDTLGCLLVVIVTAANLSDSKVAPTVCKRLQAMGYERLATILADGGYRGKWQKWLLKCWGWVVKIILRKDTNTFQILPKRWIVERTFAWLQWNRRLSRDFECETNSAEAQIYIAHIYRLLRKF